ncbi:MAG: NAD-glutamate dehydrogenase, partial [Candidatus Obscuribacterales bacterium]|nr:NAD-glutamate dehydrogenase [Steroidobacteraceae bacterium]
NTDFIDNSAGVDCSDHEVNIKILLNAATIRGLKTTARDKLLVRMTDDVGALVLRDNYLQSQALSVAELSAAARLSEHAHFIRSLELSQELDRNVEHLPSIEEIAERQKQDAGLTRPELAVLLSYSKIALFNRLILTDVPEDAFLGRELERYFPPLLVAQYRPLLRRHRLRREIIATAITNSLVNRMGPTFALRVQEDTGADAGAIARAYTTAREAFEMRDLWQQIEALDTKIHAAIQYAWMSETTRLLRFVTYWLIQRPGSALSIDAQVAILRPGLRQLRTVLPKVFNGLERERYDEVRKQIRQQIPAASKLVDELALLETLASGPDIIDVARESQQDLQTAAEVYFRIGAALSLDWLRAQVVALRVDGRWQAIARNTLREQLHSLQRALCMQILAKAKRNDATNTVDQWLAERGHAVKHAQQTLQEMRALPNADFATISVATQSLRLLTEH